MKKISALLILLLASAQLFSFPNREKMEARVGTISRELTYATFDNPKENLPALVEALTASANSDQSKVKLIHDWICHNIEYDTELWFSGKTAKQDYETVIKKQKAVCSGYSSVFVKMCQLAGIEAIRIQGHSKGFGYSGKLQDYPNHEWNGVFINNVWKLVDCCWDAGYVDYKTFIKHYSTEWFLLPADQFIYSHLPIDPTYQFLPENKLRSIEQFEKEPYIPGKFFKYGFRIIENEKQPEYTTIIDGPTSFTFKMINDNISTSAGLQNQKTHQAVENITWVDRKGSKYTYEFDVPDKNDYKAYIFAKNTNDVTYPDKFSIYDFENQIIPRARALIQRKPVATKSISQEDFDIFLNAFKKIPENGYYIYKENQFYRKQQNVVTVIYNMIKVPTGYMEPVLDFDIIASENYNGAGEGKKYPITYDDYNATTNTHLISPRQATLKKGQEYTFQFDSTNYVNFAVLENEELLPFARSPETGLFEFTYKVPETAENVVIFGSKNGTNYAGLLQYAVE